MTLLFVNLHLVLKQTQDANNKSTNRELNSVLMFGMKIIYPLTHKRTVNLYIIYIIFVHHIIFTTMYVKPYTLTILFLIVA